MQKAKQPSLFIAISLWAIIIGGIVYSHIVFFPPYLSHLPESNKLITGVYGLNEGNFWMFIHPLAFLSTIIALILNWKKNAGKKSILISLAIYTLALIVTAIYFLPGLTAFANSNANTSISLSEWFQRGQTWQHLSWVRGFFMFIGFINLLIALTKSQTQNSKL